MRNKIRLFIADKHVYFVWKEILKYEALLKVLFGPHSHNPIHTQGHILSVCFALL